MSDIDYAARIKRQAEERLHFGPNILTKPTVVDERTYTKGGITSGIEYNKIPYFNKACH
jgi:hypothetical protein